MPHDSRFHRQPQWGTVVRLSAVPEEECWWHRHTAVASPLTAAGGTVAHLTRRLNHQGTANPVSAGKESSLFIVRRDGVTTVHGQGNERGLGARRAGGLWLENLPRAAPWGSGSAQRALGFLRLVYSLFCAVGHPIPVHQTLHPTPEQIEELHQTYMEELRKLFEEHKGKYGIPEQDTLVFK